MIETAETTTNVTDLSSLLTSSKTVELDYPGFPDFKVNLTYLSKDEMLKIRKKCVTTKFDRKTRQPIEDLNEELFLKEYIKGVIKGWKGLKFEYLKDLILIDTDQISDMKATLPFSQDNAEILMKESNDFDTWVSETVTDLANFT